MKKILSCVAVFVLLFGMLVSWHLAKPASRTLSFTNAAVVSVDPIASDVGRQILKKGGNAIDAAIATGFALAVTHPFAGNLGGGGFMLIYLAEKGEQVTAIDYHEKAPARSTPPSLILRVMPFRIPTRLQSMGDRVHVQDSQGDAQSIHGQGRKEVSGS